MRRGDSIARRLLWSIAILVPLIGPLAYAAAYRPPTSQDGGYLHDAHGAAMGAGLIGGGQ
jgi:hypothetical protein